MTMIQHNNVVSVREVFATDLRLFIVMDFIGGGELFDKIVESGRLSEIQSQFYFRQLIDGVEYLHDNGICHRDLKPEVNKNSIIFFFMLKTILYLQNILLDIHGNLKISDFGFATLNIESLDEHGNADVELLHSTCGTANYVAPEVLSRRGYNGKISDVWSVGVILFVLLAGFLPFEEENTSLLFAKIKSAEYSFPAWFSYEARDLIRGILRVNPSQRYTLRDIRQHCWMSFKRDLSSSPPTAHLLR